jgi:hypothetical protein
MEKLTFVSLAEKVLNETKEPLTATEIWQIALKKGYVEKLQSKGSTPSATLAAVLYQDATKVKDSKFIRSVDDKRKTYLLKARQDKRTTRKKKLVKKQVVIDVPSLLCKYVSQHMNLTVDKINIDGTKQTWTNPTVIGSSMEDGVKGFVLNLMGKPVKKQTAFCLVESVDENNVHERYFQAVSNSTLMDKGYLVVTKPIETECMEIIEMLNKMYGVGLIELNIKSVSDSNILFPARQSQFI